MSDPKNRAFENAKAPDDTGKQVDTGLENAKQDGVSTSVDPKQFPPLSVVV